MVDALQQAVRRQLRAIISYATFNLRELKDIHLDLSCFRILSAITLTAVLACNAPNVWAQAADDTLKLNQIQVIVTHNSYHAGIAPNESKVWQAKNPHAYKGVA